MHRQWLVLAHDAGVQAPAVRPLHGLAVAVAGADMMLVCKPPLCAPVPAATRKWVDV